MTAPSSLIAVAVAGSVFVVGCSKASSPTTPSGMGTLLTEARSGPPEYERAYYNGTIVTMNHIQVPQNPGPLAHAAADLYAVFYPANHALWPVLPLCNPCDHPGIGNDPRNFHDHVLDSIPSDPGHGEFNPLWHVFAIRPANTSPAGVAAFAARLPMTSEAAVDAAVAAGVAVEIDTGSYFMCSIVNEHAAKEK